jgi:hypothetical protein
MIIMSEYKKFIEIVRFKIFVMYKLANLTK